MSVMSNSLKASSSSQCQGIIKGGTVAMKDTKTQKMTITGMVADGCNSNGIAKNAKMSDAMEWALYFTGSCNGCQDFNKGLCHIIGNIIGRCRHGSSWNMFHQCQDSCGKCDSCADNSDKQCSDASCSIDYDRLFHCKKSCKSCQVKCSLGIKIQDAVSRSNLTGVDVTFKIATLGMNKGLQTGSDGQVSLTEIPETATATIEGEKSGYFKIDTTSTAIKDNCDGVLTFDMVRECSLTVKVIGLDGSNLDGVKVEGTVPDMAPKVINTGINGQAKLEKLPETATAALTLSKSRYTLVEMSKPMRDNCDAVLPAVTLIRECDLKIEVVGLDRTNLEGVEVTVSIPDTAPTVQTTGSNGQAGFEKLPESATAGLSLTKSRYTAVEMTKAMRDNCDAMLPTITLIRECDLTIKATGFDGSNLEGVEVTLSIPDMAPKVISTGSNGQGKYEKVAETATASLTLSKTKYTSVDLTKLIKDNCDAVVPVTLIRQCSLIVKATDISGSPLSSTKVTLTIEGADTEMTTGSDGQASFMGLSETATASISVEKTGYFTNAVTRAIKDNCDGVVPVSMVKECSLGFTITDGSTGSSIEGVVVTITIDGESQSMTTNSQGAVNFEKLSQTATASIKVQKSGYVTVQTTKPVVDNCDAVIPLAALTPSCDLTVKATDENGSNLNGITVQLTTATVNKVVASGSDGEADFLEIPRAETATIILQKTSYPSYFSKTVTTGVNSVCTGPIQVTLSRSCSFSFKMTDAINGDSISGATVTLTSTETGQRTYQSSGSGYANVPDIPYNADLTITVASSSHDLETFNFNSKDNCDGPTLPVAMNPTSPDGRLVLTWKSDNPSDLDFYMQDSTGCKLYYGNTGCRQGASSLDKDNTNGGISGGSETITVSNRDAPGIKTVVWVDHYDGSSDMCTARAEVKYYPGNGVPGQKVTIPENCNGARTWVVGCFDSGTGLQSFVVKNVLKSTRANDLNPANES